MAQFREEEHPRADDGKFTAGNGGKGGKTPEERIKQADKLYREGKLGRAEYDEIRKTYEKSEPSNEPKITKVENRQISADNPSKLADKMQEVSNARKDEFFRLSYQEQRQNLPKARELHKSLYNENKKLKEKSNEISARFDEIFKSDNIDEQEVEKLNNEYRKIHKEIDLNIDAILDLEALPDLFHNYNPYK